MHIVHLERTTMALSALSAIEFAGFTMILLGETAYNTSIISD